MLFALLSAASAADEPVILIVGDSLSAAYGLDVEQGWVSLMKARLDAQGYCCTPVNASISGDTTRGGLARLPRTLARHDPALVIIELGANDGLRGIPIGEIRANLAAMIEASRDSGADVALLGMRIPPNYGQEYAQKFHGVFAELADEYEVLYEPFLMQGAAADPRYLLDDGIHPNADGQRLMLERVWDMLVPWLRDGACGGRAD